MLILETITSHLTRLLCEYSRVTFDSLPHPQTTIDEFALDSLDIINVITDVEKAMRIKIEDKELDGTVQSMTIAHFAEWINERIV